MKNKRLKNYLKFGILLFGISLCLIGCQKDDGISVEQQTDNRAFDLEFIQFNEFVNAKATNEGLLNQSIEKLNSQYSTFSRITEANSFLIDSTRIAHIQHPQGYSSYSLPVISDTDTNILQNIIISQLSDGTEISFLAEYRTDVSISELDIESLNQHINGTKLTRLVEPTLNYANRSTTVCVDYIVYTEVNECSFADTKPIEQHPQCFHADGTPVTIITVSIETECTTVGGGGGSNWPPSGYDPDDDGFNPYDDPFGDWGGSGGNGTSTGGGNNSDGNNDTNPCEEDGVATSINDGNGNCIDGIGVPLLPNPQETNNPCNKITEQIANTDFNNRLFGLLDHNDDTIEHGYLQYTDGSFSNELLGNTNNGNAISFPLTTDIIGFMHLHTDDYEFTGSDGLLYTQPIVRMFSPADVYWFLQMLKNAEDNNRQLSDVYVYMASSQGTYTLRFNGNDLNGINTDYTGNQLIQLNEDYRKYFKEEYPYNRERAFLNFINDKMGLGNDSGMEFYKVKSNGSVKRKKLKPNGKVEKVNCD